MDLGRPPLGAGGWMRPIDGAVWIFGTAGRVSALNPVLGD